MSQPEPLDRSAPATEPVAPNTLACLLSLTDGVGSGGDRAGAEALLLEMVLAYTPARRAFHVLERMAEEAGVLPDDPDWHDTTCGIHATYDQLVQLAEPSGWSDPGFLIDPLGAAGAPLERLLSIARARQEHGEARTTAQHLTWLTEAAAREDGAQGRALRRTERLKRWPFNAVGAMDGPDGPSHHPMVFGSLNAVEQRFRADAAHVDQALRETPDDLRRAHRLLQRLSHELGELSLRMNGLIMAGFARLYVVQATVAGHRIPRPAGHGNIEAAERFARRATHLLLASGARTNEDHRGHEALLARIVSWQDAGQ